MSRRRVKPDLDRDCALEMASMHEQYDYNKQILDRTANEKP